MKISFGKPTLPTKGDLLLTATKEQPLGPMAKEVDKLSGGALSRAIKSEDFKAAAGSSLTLLAPAGTELERVVLLGLGDAAKLTDLELQNAGGRAYNALSGIKRKAAVIAIDDGRGWPVDIDQAAALMGSGVRLASYRFDKYLANGGDGNEKNNGGNGKPVLNSVRVLSTAALKSVQPLYDTLDKITDGVFMTRDLVSEPANVIYPETLAHEAKTLEKLGIKVTILGEKEMRKLGMGALLGVGQGSARESKLVTLEWNGLDQGKGGKGKAKKKAPTSVAFVGKGVTFDTGGISIKPAAGMEDMKWDMGGSAVVVGLMKALAGRQAKVNAVGIIGLVENMPSGTAQRPGDIVTSMSGKTIEVLNTDAEGRLVLADALWYCQETFKPGVIVDLATLTGAIIVSLGMERAGMFVNDDALSTQLMEAGEATGEKLWRQPLDDAYDKQLKSAAADMKNIGGRWGGSITAAKFLQRFIQEGVKWAHLDIAGVTWRADSAPLPIIPKGGTGFGVRLLDRYVAKNHESS